MVAKTPSTIRTVAVDLPNDFRSPKIFLYTTGLNNRVAPADISHSLGCRIAMTNA